jgi:hypothetical protein
MAWSWLEEKVILRKVGRWKNIVFGGFKARLGFDGQAKKIDEWALGVGELQPGSINQGRFSKQWGLSSQRL